MSELAVKKSTRHQAIIGHFGEYLICNWLSRSGFEVAIVDHTGIDIVAYNPSKNERLGITVKSRTRNAGAEADHLTIFRSQNRDREKVIGACASFGCTPWIGIYIETERYAEIFLLSLIHYDEVYKESRATKVNIWSMRKHRHAQYLADPEIKHIRLDFSPTHWWSTELPIVGPMAEDE